MPTIDTNPKQLITLPVDDGPATPSIAWCQMQERIQLVRALEGGTNAMRKMGTIYLPRHPKESEDHYNARLGQTFLFNVFERSVRSSGGKPFAQPATIDNTTPELDVLLKDVDLRGNDLSTFGRKALEESIRTGMVHILVDFPRVDRQRVTNLAEEQALKLRPYFTLIKAEQLIAAEVQYIGGVPKLVHARIKLCRRERVRFTEQLKHVVLVLGVGTWVEYTWDALSARWAITGFGETGMSHIPMVTIYAGSMEDDFVVKPPYEDLAWKNVEHWQSSSDQRNILKYGRFPMLAAKGYEPKYDPTTQKPIPLEVGPAKILTTPVDGEFYYVEPEGKAIEAGAKDLESIAEQMNILAMRPQLGNKNYITATGAAVDEVDENAAMKAFAVAAQQAFQQCIVHMGHWVDKDWSKVTVTLNGDFDITADRAMGINTTLGLIQGGGITVETGLTELQALGAFKTRFNAAEEAAKVVKAEGVIPSPTPGNDKNNSSKGGVGGQSTSSALPKLGTKSDRR